ncbi:MAG: ABC transporter ATP-binding protein [Chlamydiia bacterium]|nr:ABC transporter ATP-binding protein [Chlamydiia bacterium]
MKLLLKAALYNRRHLILLIFTFFGMIFVTIASQMEMFALGVMAKAGPDAFVLFANRDEGTLRAAHTLSLEEVETKFKDISKGKNVITLDEANKYVSEYQGHNLVQKISIFLDKTFHIHSNLLYLACFLIIVAVFKAISLFCYRYFTRLVSIRVSRDLRQQYFEHIQTLPMSFYHEYNIGSLSARVTGDAGTVALAINSMLINYIQTPFALLSTLTACFYISWRLSLVIFLGFPMIVLPIIYIARKIKKITKQMQRNQEGFASTLIDFLAGVQTVKMFAMEDFSMKKYREQNDKLAHLEERSSRYGLSSRPILHTVASLFFAVVIIYGLYVVNMGIAELLVFCGLLYVFYEPIKKFAEENNQILRGVAGAERMYEVLNQVSSILDDPNAMPMEGLKDSIEFDNISFRYNNDWVLKNLSFKVKKGEMVAIVGPTGGGKSTIVQLIPRLYDVQEGEIRIDGKPLKAYTQRSLKENIAFVAQEPFLFLDTVRENISFGRQFDQSKVEKAAKLAQAHEFIEKLPRKYETMLLDAGKNLSGGQQQRLAIARALVKEAPILILDEATSALDAVSEGKIKEVMEALRGKMTQIIIAHRFTTIENADRIIYLERGQVVADGTKEELFASCPGFRIMWEMMSSLETPVTRVYTQTT